MYVLVCVYMYAHLLCCARVCPYYLFSVCNLLLLLLCMSSYLRDFPLATEDLSPLVVVAFVNFNMKKEQTRTFI